MAWRYIATRLNGDGTETPLDFNVPIKGAAITEDLSGPGGITGTISPELAELQDEDGRPLLQPWSTAIYAEADGFIRGGAILVGTPENGPNLDLDAVGFSGYIQGEPYTGDRSRIDVDPLDEARHIWEHYQSRPGGNIGLVLDGTTSPVRIGEPERTVEFTTGAGEDVSFEAGPYKLAWWQTDDLGKEFDDLATRAPFDYRVVHEWDGDGETIRHRMVLGYPRLGRRRHDLIFVEGENIRQVIPIDHDGEDYASEVLVLGAGEGRAMVRGSAVNAAPGRLRRVVTVSDKSIQTKKAADARAEQELKLRSGEPDLADDIEVADHPHAPLGSYSPGDEILVETAGAGWSGRLAIWCRILAATIHPEAGTTTLTIVRAEKVS